MAGTPAQKKTVEAVVKVLTKAQKVMSGFKFGGVEFNPADLGVVAPLVGNKIALQVVDSDDGLCRYTSHGDPAKNDIILDRKSMNKRPFLGTIVHEGVHAVNDLRKRTIHSHTDEGMGYVACMMFLAKINISTGGNPIFDAAEAVYQAILSPKGKDRKAVEQALIDAIKNSKIYPAETRKYNGIKGVG